MERPLTPAQRDERIAQAMERLNAALARVSEAEEALVEAKEGLSLARLALEDSTARGANNSRSDDAAERSWREEDDSGAARGAG